MALYGLNTLGFANALGGLGNGFNNLNQLGLGNLNGALGLNGLN
jgi:hypothetical protein